MIENIGNCTNVEHPVWIFADIIAKILSLAFVFLALYASNFKNEYYSCPKR